MIQFGTRKTQWRKKMRQVIINKAKKDRNLMNRMSAAWFIPRVWLSTYWRNLRWEDHAFCWKVRHTLCSSIIIWGQSHMHTKVKRIDKTNLEKHKEWKKTYCTYMSDGCNNGTITSAIQKLVNSPSGTVFPESHFVHLQVKLGVVSAIGLYDSEDWSRTSYKDCYW